MKRILQMAAFALLVMLGSSWRNNASAQPDYDDDYYGGGDDISYQEFYDELSPYGRWIDYPEYGYVWAPNGITGFRPYETGGHWVWTDGYEWMWVSDYSWGWAPFHYGRWFYDPVYGWMWMPGYEWAPAWVAWRDGGDYYGWAPLRPGFNVSININIGSYNPPVDYWCFAPRRYISSPRIYDYCLDRGRNVTIINNTTIINNYGRRNNVFYNGPRRTDAERYAGRINPVRFRESSRRGGTQFRNNEVSVYRPGVRRDDNRQFTPRSFDRYERNGRNDQAAGRDNDNRFRRNGNNLPSSRGDNDRFGQRDNNANNGQQGNEVRSNRRFGNRNDQQADRNSNRNFERRRIDRNNNDANSNQPGGQNRNWERRFEQRNNNDRQQQGSNENRRFERNNNSSQQQERQMRNNNRFERQPSQQGERQQQREFRRNDNSGGGNSGREQRGGNGNNGGERRSFGRRN